MCAGVRTELRGDVALQEASFEYHIANLSDRYDSISIKAGIQPFNSDFRGFIFNDTNLGARLFGNLGNNRYQYNLAFFDMLEKETNSGLNTFNQARSADCHRQPLLARFAHARSYHTVQSPLFI